MFGIIYLMMELEEMDGSVGGPRGKHIERWAVDRLVEAANRVGIKPDRIGYQKTKALFDSLFVTAGVEAPSYRLLTDRRKAFKDDVNNLL